MGGGTVISDSKPVNSNILDHDDAMKVAMTWCESANIARCYIDAIKVLKLVREDIHDGIIGARTMQEVQRIIQRKVDHE